MASSKKKKQKLIGANRRPEQASGVAEPSPEPAKPGAPPKGLNRIPVWLHRELGLSDTISGSIVVLVNGGLIMAVVYILAVLWPAS